MKLKKLIFSRAVLLFLLAATMVFSFFGGYIGIASSKTDNLLPSEEVGGFDFQSDTLEVAASTKDISYKDLKLIPGGIAFGVKFQTEGIMVVGFDDVETSSGKTNPAFDAGIREKDVIIKLDGKELRSAAELTEAVETCEGRALTLTYTRNGKEYTAKLTPRFSDSDGKYKTGLWVRDSGAGIGTVTYIDPQTLTFGGLGHGICDSETGGIIPLNRGTVMDVTIGGVQKGAVGAPGEIKGYFSSSKTGTLYSNTYCGVFGLFGELPKNLPSGAIPIGTRSEIKDGDAYIWCTLDESGPQRYSIKISEINRSANGNKCFTVTVNDKKLIEKTGGIVQGMSGSPIIQNGKLVGAVTHVLINDPTSGYGIFIENMLNMAQMPMAKAS